METLTTQLQENRQALDSLLGGDHYLLLLGLLCTKVGLLIKSMGIANDVVGV